MDTSGLHSCALEQGLIMSASFVMELPQDVSLSQKELHALDFLILQEAQPATLTLTVRSGQPKIGLNLKQQHALSNACGNISCTLPLRDEATGCPSEQDITFNFKMFKEKTGLKMNPVTIQL
ncbi:hypothetical protein ACJX0J_011595, partial [Zea mays]